MPERTTFSLVAWLVVVLGVAAWPRERAAVADTLPFRRLSSFSRRSQLFRSAVIGTLFAALAALDFATNPDLSFLVFYLLPVLLASWFLGRRQGLLVSLASVGAWTLDDVLTQRVYVHVGVPIWNRAGVLAFFVFLSWLAGVLREALDREVRERSERLERDLAMARDVQASLLPPRHLDGGRYSVAAECHQAYGVGGDVYDVQTLGSGALFVAIGDVSGKGMAAALLMSSFLASLRLLLPVHAGRLDVLAAELSERLRTSLATPRFVTAFVAILEDGWLRYVNAGHNPGFLVVPGAGPAGVVSLHSTGTVLGLIPAARFREERVLFPPGGRLVLYTDGLSECTNPDGRSSARSGSSQPRPAAWARPRTSWSR
ncbi:MAG: SpoIIE family protein phosphatase [Holophagales bacterium]|nr:SpoIIE family protein phosphatase [Holophagales bacterium]